MSERSTSGGSDSAISLHARDAHGDAPVLAWTYAPPLSRRTTQVTTLNRARRGIGGFGLRARRGIFDQGSLLWGVIIIGIVGAIAAANWSTSRDSAGVSACKGNEIAISSAAELYYLNNQTYPASNSVTAANTVFKDGAGLNYLKQIPVDPADATRVAAYTWTNTTAAATGPAYSISCPGTHPNASLKTLQGYTATSKTIYMDNTTNPYTQ